ncbi:hypothetical protein BMS3Bbin06_01795 [bacterium BMS3Bbin06]|nr:hypothetical protein BMS3Bbin06_01795 [bacterium BMS3Bbin06]
MSLNKKAKEKAVKELIIKAGFLSYVSLFSVVIFFLLLIRFYPDRDSERVIFLFALAMEVFSFIFFLYIRRIIGVLRGNPDVNEIIKLDGFLSFYYYPKFIFRNRKKKNPFIVPDDEDDT